MKMTIRMFFVLLAMVGFLVVANGCNDDKAPAAQCRADNDCPGDCNLCKGGACVNEANCCTVDSQCGGRRCINVPGTRRGTCQ